jgi:hypothetical protein
MRKMSGWGALIPAAILIGLIYSAVARSAASSDASPNGTKVVEGLVRDISCPIQNKDATATVFNMKCAQECARQGSPLIILSKEGVIYIPISDSMPDKDQRQRLMPFIGKYVRASGKIYERAGTRAIAIDKIDEMKEVHLVTDAH